MSTATENQDEQQFTDLSDPLAFLSALQQSTAPSPPGSSSHESSSASADSPPDWSQFSTLWDSTFKDPDLDAQVQPSAPAPGTVKPASVDMFNFMPMDLDAFDFSAPSVDPSALHFGLGVANQDFFDPSAFSQQPRRLSVTSSSSSSGASLSPSLDFSSSPASNTSMTMQPPAPAAEASIPINDPIALLAHQARQSAGVTLAVPTNSMAQAGKLPIPRLRPGTSPTSSAPSSSFPSPSPQATPAPTAAAPDLPPLAPGARTKTSHTTIERRYRTNLNTRIQGLKDAVPALRVLERRKASEKAGLPFTEEPADLLDARGYADGVKVARKVSKANVLGKAAEYIRVLKRREARLEREKDGLRELIQGLVGGQALLREFEAGWAAKYGGKERDELEYEGVDDDDDDDDEDDEDDGGRARKRPRVEKKPVAPAKPAEQPEKRKRGRPRKEQPAPVVAPVPPPVTAAAQPAPGAQYLLAAFAFFSFFNMPGRTPTHTHYGHSGTVLTSAPGPSHPAAQAVFGVEWHDLIGAFHLLVSALVFASIVMPWLPAIMKALRLPSDIGSTLRRPSFTRKPSEPSTTSSQQDPLPRLALVNALSPAARGAPDEAAQLRAALRIWPGLTGVLVRVVGKISRGRRADRGFERLQLEQRAWMRLGEVIALDGTASFGNRVQAYLGAMSHMPAFSPQPSDLATLALLALPLSPARAEGLWQKAAAAREMRPAERRALERLDVRTAAAALKSSRAATLAKQGASPLQALGVLAARDDIRAAAAKLFVRAVSPASAGISADAEKDVRETVLSARALGGNTARLAILLDALAHGTTVPADAADALGDGAEAAVLAALVRVRALFPSTIADGKVQVVLSPAAGESAGKMRALLRRTLGHEAFEEPGLEEARDRVVDMICEGEASERRKTRRT
ncbi:unnamed protein product [Peniophora sp. CBMAI 1063]|nr:unnamed protein product [Peniophora sp. CBMAI 1063]